jgi:exonuclease SbcC
MLITRLELENIKSYRHISIDFQRGTTAISGANGAGKTTLVEAIGFALFDSMPYKQDQFVREGEKYGRVVVELLGNDDRPYVVERRCGAGASWALYDLEANLRLEQRADVQDKLRELFGIERERSLASLFRDALGVPQGTFTAIFLQTASTRKATFDSLLQIEDYTTASGYLLEAQKQYRDQALEQDREIQRLTFETRELETWRGSLKEKRELDQELKARNVRETERLARQQKYLAELKERRDHLAQCEMHRARCEDQHNAARQRLQQAEEALNETRAAHQMVEKSKPDYERYVQAEQALALLRQDERLRNRLRQQQGTLESTRAATQANIRHIQGRLDEVAQARQLILELIPQVEKQSELDTQIATLTFEAQQYETLRKEGNRLYQLREKSQQELVAIRKRIAEIEPLQPLADLLDERVRRLAQLETQITQRGEKRLQMEEKQQAVQEKKAELKQAAAKLRHAEKAIALAEEHRQEAEEYALLQEQSRQLALELHHLQGNIEGYTDARSRSAGGQCPLLHQTCLNIKQQGQLSLEAYFDGLLSEEQARLDEITRQLAQIDERSASLKQYAEALEQVGQHIERRDSQAEHIERLNVDIRRLEREEQSLKAEWEELGQIEQEIARAKAERDESRQADKQVRLLAGLSSQAKQLQEQIEQYTAELEERKQEAEPLKQSKKQLEERKQELAALNDPRSRSRAAQEIMKPEATYRQQLQAAQGTLEETSRQIDELSVKLEKYAQLDQEIGQQEGIRDQAATGHQLYQENLRIAARLPEKERAWEEARQEASQAAQALAQAEAAYRQASAVFDKQEFAAVESEVNSLERDIATLAKDMEHLQAQMNKLEADIVAAEALLVELEAARKEKQTLEDLSTMMEQFRKLIKEAAPHVLRAMLSDISAEANRIFGEIMGDRSAQLSWADDYEISLLRQGNRRSFAQLSGGEQMSAALAVRLALLKKLSTLNLAFFDEPTQNMDELRRTNLAEQIRRVRGFDQLIVISHDDTFEQGLDSHIRLRKQDGSTRLLAENDDSLASFDAEESIVLAAPPAPPFRV